MNDCAYEPLAVDESCEQPIPRRGGLWGGIDRVCEWLDARLPFILAPSPPPRGRRSAERQLEARKRFPAESWQEAGFDVARVVPILNIVQKALMWPNNRFLPRDPGLLAFVTPDKWDLGDAAACRLIAQHLSIDLAGRDVGRMIEDNRTLGEIVGWLLEKAERREAAL